MEFFSTLDMCQGYHQIEIAEEDRSKTTFVTRYGLYQYRKMPLDCNAPATFQRVMALVLRGMSCPVSAGLFRGCDSSGEKVSKML